jgi:hypothetical protein
MMEMKTVACTMAIATVMGSYVTLAFSPKASLEIGCPQAVMPVHSEHLPEPIPQPPTVGVAIVSSSTVSGSVVYTIANGGTLAVSFSMPR